VVQPGKHTVLDAVFRYAEEGRDTLEENAGFLVRSLAVTASSAAAFGEDLDAGVGGATSALERVSHHVKRACVQLRASLAVL
jgi:hypothetical protein